MIVTVQNLPGRVRGALLAALVCAALVVATRPAAAAQPVTPDAQAQSAPREGGEASLVLPDLATVDFRGVNGRSLLMGGLVVCALGMLFGWLTFTQLKSLPVHASMREVSELIYEPARRIWPRKASSSSFCGRSSR